MPSTRIRGPKGAGSIYLRQDGRYEASTRALMPNGGHRRVRVYGKTRAEAHAKLHTIVDRTIKGIPEPDRSWSVADWLDHWIESSVKLRNRERTVELYEGIVRRYLKPNIGSKRLKELSVADFQATINHLAKKGVGPRTIQQTRMVLSSALTRALRDELVYRNVARLVDLPKYTPKEIHPWTIADAQTFLRATADHPWELGYHLLLTYGMRRGEVLGLRWQDVDLDEGIIRVRQQLQRVNSELVTGPVKTDAGRRTLPLLPHIRALVESRLESMGTAPDHDLVLTSSVGTPIDPKNFVRTFHQITDSAGLRRITVHQTRHTAATLLKSFGVQPRDVQLILGHSNISTTEQLYQHGYIDEHREALQRVATALTAHDSDTAARVSEEMPAGQISRQRRLISESEAIEPARRQAAEANEKRHLTEVEMAAFDGGTSGARTHDTLLKSLTFALSETIPTSVIHHHHTHARRQLWGAQAVKSCRQNSALTVAQMAWFGDRVNALRSMRDALGGVAIERLRRRSFPLCLIPSTHAITKERS